MRRDSGHHEFGDWIDGVDAGGARASQLGRGGGEHDSGLLNLVADQPQVLLRPGAGGIQRAVETVGTGLDVAQRLRQIMNEVHEDLLAGHK